MALKEWADLLQGVVTTVALLVGGAWTYMLFVQKRQRYPRTSIEHRISHRRLESGKLLLTVEVVVANTGDVLVALEKGETLVKQLLPPAPALARKAGNRPARHQATGWDLIAFEPDDPGKHGVEIEPGNVDQSVYNFIVDGDLETIQVYSYFENVEKRRVQIDWRGLRISTPRRLGWHHTSTYDLAPAKRPIGTLTAIASGEEQEFSLIVRSNHHDLSRQRPPT